MPKYILTIKDASTQSPLPGATVFGSNQTGVDNDYSDSILFITHADINGNILLDSDNSFKYLVTALYLTEDNLKVTDTTATVSGVQVPDAVQEADGKYRVRDAAGDILGESSDKSAAESEAQNEAARRAALASGATTSTTLSYWEIYSELSSNPKYAQFSNNIDTSAFALFDKDDLLTGTLNTITLDLKPKSRASLYWPTNAQISRIPIVNPPASNTVTEVPRKTMSEEPDPTITANSQLNDELKTENNKTSDRILKSQLSPQARLVNIFNSQKDKIRRKIIPFLIALLLPFGAAALQAVLAKLPLNTIKDLASCPNRAELLRLIEKRNKLVRQINAIYKTVTTLSKITLGLNTAVTAIRIGILAATFVPLPAPPGVPVGLAKLEETAKKFNVVLNVATVALATIGTLLGVILVILRSLDALMLQCAEDPNYNTPPNEPLPVDAGNVRIAIPFEEINTELDSFINESTGLSNSDVIQATQQQNNIYKGFTLELKLDTTSNISYPRRFAQAVNRQGVPVLKTDSSFASDPQVLLDQLKFIIDSNPQLTAE